MKKMGLFKALTFTIFWLPIGSAQAVDYFLSIDTIKGESLDRFHKDWIDIDSFSWGVVGTGSVIGGGSGAGKAMFSPFSWTQQLDRSVPPIFLGVASGVQYRNATLEVTRVAGGREIVFFQMSFDNVLLNKLNIVGAGDLPGVAAAFDYGKITMTYRPQNPNGSYGTPVVGGWDIANSSFFGSSLVLEGLFLAGPTPSPVPEPETWGMLLTGLGLLGFRLRYLANPR